MIKKDNSKNILEAAKWCFLNFGYSKTSMEDVAKKAKVSRALIYKKFKNKEEIALDVFNILLAPDYGKIKKIADSRESKEKRLMQICQIISIDPWREIAAAPMAKEFIGVCELVEPESCAKYEKIMQNCFTKILGNKDTAELFILSLEGLQCDIPPVEVLEKRVAGLVHLFASAK